MPNTPTSRKLCHILRYLFHRQIEFIVEVREKDAWDKFQQGMIDLSEAAILVSKIRDEELGWSE